MVTLWGNYEGISQCIAWIRNSVDDAIKVHRQLLARGVIPASSLSLFHSRFAFSDRQRIETETLARFGKYCSLQRASQVIVCTQVIEQSVDIDLDEMISDLAPVDLLIQRAGRLQRHIRDINGQLSGYWKCVPVCMSEIHPNVFGR